MIVKCGQNKRQIGFWNVIFNDGDWRLDESTKFRTKKILQIILKREI